MCHWATLLLLSSSFSSSQKSTLDNQITFLTCSRGNKYIVCTWMSDSSMQKWKPVTLSLLQLYPSTHRLMVAKHPGLTIPIMSKMKCTTYRGAVFNTVSLFACKCTVQGEGFEGGGWVWHPYPAKQRIWATASLFGAVLEKLGSSEPCQM